jgi:hypothetical protein
MRRCDQRVVRGDELLQDHVHRGITSTLGITGGSVFDERRFIDSKQEHSTIFEAAGRTDRQLNVHNAFEANM